MRNIGVFYSNVKRALVSFEAALVCFSTGMLQETLLGFEAYQCVLMNTGNTGTLQETLLGFEAYQCAHEHR